MLWSSFKNSRKKETNKLEVNKQETLVTTWTQEIKEEDWQVITIADSFYDEVDCNSGRHRRVRRESGNIEYLD